MENIRILIIEDDVVISRLLSLSLKTNGYLFDVVGSGLEGINYFINGNYDIVLLDLGLPDFDGMKVLEEIRQISEVPIIIISARGREADKVKALDQGADDYITKPFYVGELLARIRVALRKKTKETTKSSIFEYENLRIDIEKRKVSILDREIHFTPIEYQLLILLIENQGKVLTHSFIQKKIWGYESMDEYQSLRVFMASIRRKIEQNTSQPQYIQTEIGVGYRFMEK